MFNIEASGAVGLLTTGIVELLKRARQIPLVSGQTKRIRTVAAVCAFLGNLGIAFADGDVISTKIAAGTIASFLVSYATYKGVIAQ